MCLCVLCCSEIRNQLVEQFKCLEQQSEARIQLLQDLQEFFRRKAEIQLEYSRSLEKLAERFSSKIRGPRWGFIDVKNKEIKNSIVHLFSLFFPP